MLGELTFSIVAGVPIAFYLDSKLKQLQQDYKVRAKLKGIFKTKEIPLKIKYVSCVDDGFISELEGDYPLYKLNMLQREFKEYFGAVEVKFSPMEGSIYLKALTRIVDNTEHYKYIPLSPYEILIGYGDVGLIVVDMGKTPHIGVVGLSTSGKSKCLEVGLRNLRGADITLVNCMKKDFRGIQANRINGNNEILAYLKRVAENKEMRERPHYILIDEYNVLSNTKGIDKVIQDLLSQARHYNVFLIVLMQVGNKEDCKFKNLFNCRLVFRTIEDSTVKAFLGATPQDGALQPREFYLLHTELVKGTTFTL